MVINANRCTYIIVKEHICKKAFGFVSNYVLTIQKAYKGYRCRKYVRLLTNLPCDIQGRILFYIREPLYNARRNERIQNILCKKFITFFGIPKNITSNFTSVFLENYRSSILIMNKAQFNEHVLYIAHLYKLYTKYFTISSIDCNNALYIISNIVKKDIQDCLKYYHHEREPYLYTNNELLALCKNVFELQKSIDAYNFEYKL